MARPSTAMSGRPWRDAIRRELAALAPTTAAPAPGPTAADIAAARDMNPADRDQMVRSMVERLATRLETEGGDTNDWGRLVRAWMTLGERAKAGEALAKARAALAATPGGLDAMNALARDLGMGS